jgi:hypothetical protein
MSEAGKLSRPRVDAGGVVDRALRNALQAQQVGRGPAQARVTNSANISLTNNTVTALTFDTERWDTGNFHSTSSNTSRFTAPTAGLYEIGGCVRFAANATGQRNIRIRLNGTSDLAFVNIPTSSATAVTILTVSTLYQLSATDYVELVALQNSGGALNAELSADYSPEFWIVRLGSQA